LATLEKIKSENTQKVISGNLTDTRLFCSILKILEDTRQDIKMLQQYLNSMNKDMHGNARVIENLKKDILGMSICSEFLENSVKKI
jgi:hypothetical protein